MPNLNRGRILAAFLATAVLTDAVYTRDAAAGGTVAAPTHQSNLGPVHTITVVGHGSTDVAPDTATVTLGVQTKADTAQDAMSQNATKMANVLSAIAGQDVPQRDVKTSTIGLYFDSRAGSYTATNDATVTIDDVTKVGAVIDAAVAAGANTSWGVTFGLKDRGVADGVALQSAVRDARTRAQAIATALGVTISGVTSATEESYTVNPVTGYAPTPAAPASNAATPIVAGQITVTAQVTVIYAFG